MFQNPWVVPPSTPPHRVQSENLSYDGEHADFRSFICCVVRQAIKMPDLLEHQECLDLLQIAKDDEEDNLRGEPHSPALHCYHRLLEGLYNMELVVIQNGYEDAHNYQTLIDISLSRWIERCIPADQSIYAKLYDLRYQLMHGIVGVEITGATPVTP